MKNLQYNQKNEPAAPGEKLISYHYVGITGAVVFFSIFFEIMFLAVLVKAIQESVSKPSPNSSLWMVLSLLLTVIGLVCVYVSAIIHVKVFNLYGNRGFEIYPEKIVFTQEYPNDLKISYKSVVPRVLVSVFIGIYPIYWLYLQVKNTRAMKHNRTSCIGEYLLLLFVPFYKYYWYYTRGKMVGNELRKRGYKAASHGWLFVLFVLLRVDFVALAIMQRDFNEIPEDTFSQEVPEPGEDSYTFNEVDKIYIKNRALYVETKKETRKMPLTSRDFRWNLDSLLKNNNI